MSASSRAPDHLAALEMALAQAWDSGSPAAGQTKAARAERAAIALRRIRSFERRGVNERDTPSAVMDLANGLVAHLERNPKLIGPLLKDYQYIAEKLLDAYREASSGSLPKSC